MNLGDIAFGRKKMNDLGDVHNFPHSKQFGKFYGEKLAGLAMIGVLVIPILVNSVDLLFPRPDMRRLPGSGRDGRRHRDNRNHRDNNRNFNRNQND